MTIEEKKILLEFVTSNTFHDSMMSTDKILNVKALIELFSSPTLAEQLILDNPNPRPKPGQLLPR